MTAGTVVTVVAELAVASLCGCSHAQGGWLVPIGSNPISYLQVIRPTPTVLVFSHQIFFFIQGTVVCVNNHSCVVVCSITSNFRHHYHCCVCLTDFCFLIVFPSIIGLSPTPILIGACDIQENLEEFGKLLNNPEGIRSHDHKHTSNW